MNLPANTTLNSFGALNAVVLSVVVVVTNLPRGI
jgi:hypothetical protein